MVNPKLFLQVTFIYNCMKVYSCRTVNPVGQIKMKTDCHLLDNCYGVRDKELAC